MSMGAAGPRRSSAVDWLRPLVSTGLAVPMAVPIRRQ